MSIGPGTRLGPYEILSSVGAGGMGEVYRARDTRLKRDVALKILPESFASDADRLARFQREAEVLASLSHPNIAAIHGLEESDGVRALVMELIDGETLADRITRGPIPIDEALPIAKQIAAALEAAHEQGIIHRDLKPANIKVTPDGVVKVLDFGLAKLSESAGGQPSVRSPMSLSPTITSPALMTGVGVLLGTAAYMSPEQARGKPVTRSTDIWAFGCVLYELVTGRAAFAGEDITEILAAVVKSEPDWSRLPHATPRSIRTLLGRCLRKDRRQRLGDAGAVRIEIEDVLSGAGSAEPLADTKKNREWLVWTAAGVLVISTLALSLWVILLRRPSADAQRIQFSVGPPGNGRLPPNAVVTVSPDGSKLAFVASDSPSKPFQLWIRAMGSDVAQPLAGTENAREPFWSPDSRLLAFFGDGKLKKIAVSGGPAQTLAESGGPAQTLAEASAQPNKGTWNREGIVLFSALGTAMPVIYRVSAAGGKPAPLTTLDASRQERDHLWPYFLPDGNHFLYLARSANPENNAIFVGALTSPERKLLLNVFSNAVYAPPGYLLFNREGTLIAQAFDAERFELRGEAVPIADNLVYNSATGRADFAASDNGVLAYRNGSPGATSELVWFDRSGKRLDVLGDPARYVDVSLSPEGSRVAVDIPDQNGNGDIWIYDISRSVRTRFTFDAADDRASVWSPDGSRIVFRSNRNGHFGLYQKASNGAGIEELVLEESVDIQPRSWSPDGRFILYWRIASGTSRDLFVLPLAGDRKPVPFARTRFDESAGQFSPDGKWVAYHSTESGTDEVYVAPFPGPGGKLQVSAAGGNFPRWRHDGREIFYRAPDNKLMALDVESDGPSLKLGAVRSLFQTTMRTGGTVWPYDVSADGQRLLINSLPDDVPAPITVLVNWVAALRK